jgi:hypothetical protein
MGNTGYYQASLENMTRNILNKNTIQFLKQQLKSARNYRSTYCPTYTRYSFLKFDEKKLPLLLMDVVSAVLAEPMSSGVSEYRAKIDLKYRYLKVSKPVVSSKKYRYFQQKYRYRKVSTRYRASLARKTPMRDPEGRAESAAGLGWRGA